MWLGAGALVAPLVACGLTLSMQAGDNRFAQFSTASWSTWLTDHTRSPRPWLIAYAIMGGVALLSALWRSSPRTRSGLRVGVILTTAAILGTVVVGLGVPLARWSWREQRVTMAAEASPPDHAWAGSYFQGDGMGYNFTLVLAPDHTFFMEWHGCMGHYESSFGTVAEHDDVLTLQPDDSVRGTPGTGLATEQTLRVVDWGERHYLIDDDQWGGLCRDILDKSEPRDVPHGLFYLREGDWLREAPGLPCMPAWMARCLRDEPAVGTVRSIDHEVFVIDGGVEQGFREGQHVMLTSPTHRNWTGRLWRVGRNEGSGRLDDAVDGEPVTRDWTVTAVD